MIAIAQMNPNLTRLEIRHGYTSRGLLGLLTIDIPQLRILQLGVTVSIDLARRVLGMLPGSVQTVSMRLPAANGFESIPELEEDDENDQSSAQDSLVMHHTLRSLMIKGDFQSDEDKLLPPFLETCSSNLTKLKCPGATPFFNKAV
ncbi:hypothetical protein BG000_001583 [Podila horticola]|nr:hypothetical protein BG000_001583 [Podila horticola]